MSELLQVFQLSSHLYATGVEQQRFWRRIHRHLLNEKSWWKRNASAVWVDVVYEGTDPYTVYFTLPKRVIEKFPQYVKEKERISKGNWSYPQAHPSVLRAPAKLAVCELKLSFDNLFSLPSKSVSLPERLPLDAGERARISFHLTPVKTPNFHKGQNVYETKMKDGFRPYRSVFSETDGWIAILNWFRNFFVRRKRGEQGAPFLSRETIRKLNDVHFKVKIRIAAEQRALPKLALPFTTLKGENEFTIRFLTKKEQRHCLKEINKQKNGRFSNVDLNPNLLGGREISYLLSFLSAEMNSGEKVVGN